MERQSRPFESIPPAAEDHFGPSGHVPPRGPSPEGERRSAGMFSVTRDPLEDPRWLELLARHPLARSVGPLWEDLAGWTSFGVGREDTMGLSGGAILAVRRIPGLPVSLGRVTCAMVGGADELTRLLRELDRVAARERVVELELRLRVPEAGPGAALFPELTGLRRAIEAEGYRALSKVEQTYVVDLQHDDDELLASFESRTRSVIKKAVREGGVVTVSRDLALLDELWKAIAETSERKSASLPPKHLVVGLAPLLRRGQVLIFAERYGEAIANLALIDLAGMPCYVLGARTRAHVEGRVPGAAQLVQYEVMRYLRDLGKTRYDLGGCEGPEPDPAHPNFGVWRFKYRLGGAHTRFLPYFRRARSEALAWLLELGHRVRGDVV